MTRAYGHSCLAILITLYSNLSQLLKKGIHRRGRGEERLSG